EEEALEREWDRCEIEARLVPPDQTIQILSAFLQKHPEHPAANFAMGHFLLLRDDEAAVGYFERAMKLGSDFISPALHRLFEYYRQAGRDAEADPIRQRLKEYERELGIARKERLKVTRRDRFLAHGLDAKVLQKLRRVLHRYPQVRSGYLVRKQVKLF